MDAGYPLHNATSDLTTGSVRFLSTQVGFVTAICATCFIVRAVIVAWSAVDKADADLDVLQHPLLNIIYYTTVEILPSALVLFILRKLPPRRPAQGYQPLPAQ